MEKKSSVPEADHRIIEASVNVVIRSLIALIEVITAAALYVWCPLRIWSVILILWNVFSCGGTLTEVFTWYNRLRDAIRLKKAATALVKICDKLGKNYKDLDKLKEFLGK